MYQNVNFLRRLLGDLLDLLIYGIVFTLIFISFSFNQKDSNGHFKIYYFYLSFLFMSIWTLLYFFILPIITKGKLISNYIFKTRIIDTKTKDYTFAMIFKRNILSSFYIFAIVIFIFSTIYKNDINDKKEGIYIVENTKTIIVLRFITTAFSLLMVLKTANYIMILFHKKKLSLTDFLSNSRVVFIKQVEIQEEELYLLKPFEKKWRKIKRFNEWESLENYDPKL
ncbi:RDD family protein [Mycoplasmopsis mustelae]|uniref:RDD family protein n=1 Tax=Mycoplasmopsis mustelae TaxID=171289 RepID=A0A4R7UC15_9BACT|nr:RDD family protein [Mycoplasmopsis mustelae]TDV23267.1 RDD family protein [Mycoplasmopsis mustelae]